MAFCPKCGVELASDARDCPLCGAAAVATLDDATRQELARASLAPGSAGIFDPDGSEELTPAERNTMRWELLSVSTLIAAVAVCGANMLIDGKLAWSLYPLFSLALVWVFLTAFIELQLLLGGIVVGLAIPLFLLALDLIDGPLTWAPTIGIPIAIIVELSIALVLFCGSQSKVKGLGLLAIALIATTLSCLGIEATLSNGLFGHVQIVWSEIVTSALLPVSAFLFYFHYRVSKVSNLRRLFRL